MAKRRRGFAVKQRKREEAEERTKNYKRPEKPAGMREAIKRGHLEAHEALKIIQNSGEPMSEKFARWATRWATRKMLRTEVLDNADSAGKFSKKRKKKKGKTKSQSAK